MYLQSKRISMQSKAIPILKDHQTSCDISTKMSRLCKDRNSLITNGEIQYTIVNPPLVECKSVNPKQTFDCSIGTDSSPKQTINYHTLNTRKTVFPSQKSNIHKQIAHNMNNAKKAKLSNFSRQMPSRTGKISRDNPKSKSTSKQREKIVLNPINEIKLREVSRENTGGNLASNNTSRECSVKDEPTISAVLNNKTFEIDTNDFTSSVQMDLLNERKTIASDLIQRKIMVSNLYEGVYSGPKFYGMKKFWRTSPKSKQSIFKEQKRVNIKTLIDLL